MKKLLSAVCLLLTAALFLPMAATAAVVDVAPSGDVYAVLSVNGSEIVVEQAPDAALMSAVDGYELYYEDEPVLSVDHLDLAPTGSGTRAYYSVNFTFEGTEREVFLTGLYGDQVEQIQAQIIAGYAAGEDFIMTDLGFIDAEKRWPDNDGDDYLCWAASSSDMLTYTGWAALADAGFDTEDDVFEAFINSFEDNGGNQLLGMAWFFNGAAMSDNSGSNGAAIIEDYPSGGYLTDYAFDALSGESALYTVQDMNDAVQKLREGCAVGLGVDIYDRTSGEMLGGHAITLWGCIVDNALDEDDPARYCSIFVTDSDSYEGIVGDDDADRRAAHNVMSLYNLTYSDSYCFNFDEEQAAAIFDYVYLEPYSQATPKETDPGASKDKRSDPDMSGENIYLTDTKNKRELNTLFESGTNVYASYRIQNKADAGYSGRAYFSFRLLDADGGEVSRSAGPYNITLNPGSLTAAPFVSFGSLEAGDYTLVCSVNPDRTADNVKPEAYYYNNARTVSFKVRDSYLLGDYDGNGSIDIMDATKIQRMLAGFTVDVDDNAAVRGDANGNGLGILDATQIQRYLVDLSVGVPLGEKRLYP